MISLLTYKIFNWVIFIWTGVGLLFIAILCLREAIQDFREMKK